MIHITISDADADARAAAKEIGITKYKSHPCRYGHGGERWTVNGQCTECGRERQRAIKRVRDPEERKRAYTKYFSKPGNMARQVERTRKWRQRNKEKSDQIQRAWYLANKRKHAEKSASWSRANREKTREYWHRRRARKRANGGDHTADEILALADHQRWKCVACRKSIRRKYHIDHIEPLILGGSNAIENIQLLCPVCNCRKGGKHPIDWAREIGRLL